MVITILPLAFFNWLSRFVLGKFALWGQTIVFVLWGLLLAWALLLIATKARRERLLALLRSINVGMPIAYSFLVLMLALLFFSSVTFVLTEQGFLQWKDQADHGVTAGALSDFFLWHFLEAIPLLNINETLKWPPPLSYESAAVGWILLLFKIAVIVPVIAAFAWYWTREKPAADATKK